MKLQDWGRRSGKTTYLVNILKARPQAHVVVFSEEERKRIIHEYNLKASESIRLHRAKQLVGVRGDVYVDEVPMVLEQLLGVCVKEGTL